MRIRFSPQVRVRTMEGKGTDRVGPELSLFKSPNFFKIYDNNDYTVFITF